MKPILPILLLAVAGGCGVERRDADWSRDVFSYVQVTQSFMGATFEIPSHYGLVATNTIHPPSIHYGETANNRYTAPASRTNAMVPRRRGRSFISVSMGDIPEHMRLIRKNEANYYTVDGNMRVETYRLSWDKKERQKVVHFGRRHLSSNRAVNVKVQRHYPSAELPAEVALHILNSVRLLPARTTPPLPSVVKVPFPGTDPLEYATLMFFLSRVR